MIPVPVFDSVEMFSDGTAFISAGRAEGFSLFSFWYFMVDDDPTRLEMQ